jgi:hypothetical protein
MRSLAVEQALACNGGLSPRPALPSARPPVVLSSGRQAGYHRVVLDVARHLGYFLPVSHPAIVGLSLPERPAGLPDEQIGFASGPPLDPSNQLACFDEWSGQDMDVIGHHHPSGQFAPVVVFSGGADSRADNVGDVRAAQPHRSFTSRVKTPVHPNESLTRGRVIRRGVAAFRQASVQAPGHEQQAFPGMPVGEAAAGKDHVNWWVEDGKILSGAGFSLQRGLQPPSGPGLKPRLQAEACSTRR